MGTRLAFAIVLGWSLCGLLGSPPVGAQDPATTSTNPLDPSNQSPEMQNAILKFRAQQFDEARVALEEAAKKDPKLPPAEVVMALMFRSANDPNRTVAYLERAVNSVPNDPEAYIALASLDLQQQRNTAAGLLFEKGLALSKSFTRNADRKKELQQRAAQGLATVAEIREDWKGAEEHLRTVVAGNPNEPNAATRLGRALFNQGSADKVKEAYKVFQDLYQAKKSEVSHPDVIMATLFQQKEDAKRALAFINEAVKKDGKNANTRLAIVRWALDGADLKIADENLKVARELDKDSFESNFYAGLVARYQRNFAESEKHFLVAHNQKPANSQVVHHLALVLIEQPEPEKQALGVEFAEINARANSDINQQPSREALITLAWTLHRTNRNTPQQIDNILQRALNSGAIGSESGYHAAKMLTAHSHVEPARKILEESLKVKAAFVDRDDAEKMLKEIAG